ncbi:MAG TPA: hypothetical protein VIY29_15090, partial [Ktedonobacteraceae bacterium]
RSSVGGRCPCCSSRHWARPLPAAAALGPSRGGPSRGGPGRPGGGYGGQGAPNRGPGGGGYGGGRDRDRGGYGDRGGYNDRGGNYGQRRPMGPGPNTGGAERGPNAPRRDNDYGPRPPDRRSW